MIATRTGRERRGFIFSAIGDLVNLLGRQSDHSWHGGLYILSASRAQLNTWLAAVQPNDAAGLLT
jgi:hypothetical protein